ncbi:MAG: YIP1 family protein [Desulfotomaculum sp.]|nr:YIP1 family protein [Desulfotomaculum sp.]
MTDKQWIEGDAPGKTEINFNKLPEHDVNEKISTDTRWIDPLPEQEEVELKPEKTKVKLSAADLIYGMLFSPVKTYRKAVEIPPVGSTLLIILGLNLVLAVMGMFSADAELVYNFNHGMMNAVMIHAAQAAAPAVVMTGFILNTIKWFFYSALLHLVAEFFGGKGRAVTTFTVYGLAGLPAVFLVPLQGLRIISGSGVFTGLYYIGAIAVFIWGVVLLTIGLREAHRFSTGRALAVVITPLAVGLLLVLLAVIMFVGFLSSLIPHLEHLRYL